MYACNSSTEEPEGKADLCGPCSKFQVNQSYTARPPPRAQQAHIGAVHLLELVSSREHLDGVIAEVFLWEGVEPGVL